MLTRYRLWRFSKDVFDDYLNELVANHNPASADAVFLSECLALRRSADPVVRGYLDGLTFLEDGEGSWFGPEFWDPGWVGYTTLLSPFLDPVPGEEIEGLPYWFQVLREQGWRDTDVRLVVHGEPLASLPSHRAQEVVPCTLTNLQWGGWLPVTRARSLASRVDSTLASLSRNTPPAIRDALVALRNLLAMPDNRDLRMHLLA